MNINNNKIKTLKNFIMKKLFLGAKGGGYYLLGDAVDSSIVKQKYGLIAVTGLLYKF